MRPINGTAHIEDGELVRLLGDELPAHERVPVARHLEQCEPCRQRLDALRSERADVDALLAGITVPAMSAARRAESLDAVRSAAARRTAPTASGTRVPFRPRLAFSGSLARAAAVAALLVAGGVAASPAGAWIVDRVRDLFQPAETAVAPDPQPTPVPAQSSAVAFTPADNELVLELGSGQERGALVIRIADSPVATARVSGGEGELDIMVLPGALRIANHYAAHADYDVTVPARLTHLRVRVGDAEEIVLRPAELGAGWSTVIGLRHGGIDDEEREL